MRQIQSIVTSGAELTKQLLGFARGGKYEVAPTDLNDSIRKSSEMFGRTKKEIRIRRRYQKNVWATMADSGQMEQVLLNLFVNAWQAMPAGGDLYLSTLNVTLGETEAAVFQAPPGDYVAVTVADTGEGMDEATKQRIFEPFFTTKEMGRGTGLGLASVYGIVKNHDGFIDVISAPGEGTTFTIYLPAIRSYEGDAETPSASHREKVVRGKGTILLVDDEDIIRDVGRDILVALGYTVTTASCGADAIERYREKGDSFDLVILDMIMPGMSGQDVFKALKDIDPSVKILLASGYSLIQQTKHLIDEGGAGFIQKPFTIRDLSKKINDMLSKDAT